MRSMMFGLVGLLVGCTEYGFGGGSHNNIDHDASSDDAWGDEVGPSSDADTGFDPAQDDPAIPTDDQVTDDEVTLDGDEGSDDSSGDTTGDDATDEATRSDDGGWAEGDGDGDEFFEDHDWKDDSDGSSGGGDRAEWEDDGDYVPEDGESCDADVDLDALQVYGDGKVVICHATGSATNPYVIINLSWHGCEHHRLHQEGRDGLPSTGCLP